MTRGALALGLAGGLTKVFGAVQRLLVARWLGAETMGLYELVLPLLGAGTNFLGLGVPTGLTVWAPAAMAKGDGVEAVRFRRATERVLAVGGLAGAAAMALFARAIAGFLGDPSASGILRVLAIALAAAVVLAGRRAWFTAIGELDRVAASNTLEQIVRVAVSIALAWLMVDAASPSMAAALAWGPAAGAILALAVLRLPRGGAVPAAPRRAHYVRLLGTGIPTWAATTFVGATAAIDPALILWRLGAGGKSLEAATALLGELLGMAMPLATAALVLYGAVSAALLPVVSGAFAAGERDRAGRHILQAYLWAAAVALPAAAGLSLLARPLCDLLYHDPGAGTPLVVAAWVAVPLGFSTIAATALTGAGAPQAQLPPLLAGTAVRIGLILALTAPMGTVGVAWASVAGWGVTALGNVAAVSRRCGALPDLRALLLGPGVAAGVLAIVVRFTQQAALVRGVSPPLAAAAALAAGLLAAAIWLLPRLREAGGIGG
jgi:stage V sporulation protein B